MPTRGLIVLAVATVVAIVACWIAIGERYRDVALVERGGGLVFPEFQHRTSAIADLEIARADSRFVLSRREDGWANTGIGGYPAKSARVEAVIGAVAGLEYVAPRTRRRTLHRMLDVEDVTAGAKSTRLTFKDADGAVLADIIVGKEKETIPGTGRPGVYVRTPGDERAWLAEGSLDVRHDAADWSDRMVVDIDARSLTTLVVRHADGEVVALHRNRPGDRKLALKNLPAGAEVEHRYQIDYMAGLLQKVTFNDARRTRAIDFVPLTAIPFFMLTGELMTSATITDRLVELSQRIIGRMRGSMAQANVLVSMFFAGMNGSVVADTATVGSLMIPAMKRAGYPAAFSAGITAVSATIGGIIPPSIAMIVLANAGGISVGALFAGGIVPGIMIGGLLMVINYVIARKNNFERSDEPFSWGALGDAGLKASFALLIPIVLVGSVVGGIAGVVEAGALTAVIALFVGLFIYRTITWSNCKGAFVRAFRNSATVFIIIAAAGPFSWLLTSLGAITELEEWLLSFTHNPLLFALVLVTFIYILGMIMDAAANIIVVGPVIIEVMVTAGYPEVQAALICVVGFLIGTVTPPLGYAYFTGAAIAKASLESVALAMLPYLVALFLMLFMLVLIPDVTMWLPTLMGFAK